MIGQKLDQYVLQFANVCQPSGNQLYETKGQGPKQIYIEGIVASCKGRVGKSSLSAF